MGHDYLVLHGVNLGMFGRRDPRHYGRATLAEINAGLEELAASLGVTLECFQTDHEGEMIGRIHRALTDGTRAVIINAGAWTHSSYAIMDALAILSVPVVEVHMSNVHAREEFRHFSVLSRVCAGSVAGFGVHSYELGLRAAHALAEERKIGRRGARRNGGWARTRMVRTTRPLTGRRRVRLTSTR